jgi:hypothetical protein
MSNWWDTKLQGNEPHNWWDKKAGVIRLREPKQTTFDLRPDPEGLPVADPRPSEGGSEAGSVSYRLSYAVSHSPTPKPVTLLKKGSPS